MSVEQDEIEKWADDYSAKLQADDQRLRCAVIVNHEDGSHFVFTHAFALRRGNWVVVFSEHNRHVVFHIEDAVVTQYAPIEIRFTLLPPKHD